jgi:lysophospholipase L1-like esterase
MKLYSYLALGDSYTLGEQVRINESFPYQLVYLLRQKNINISAPEIVATTGFTTNELRNAISRARLLKQYDFVTLLIGVNNQYRGREIEEFAAEFEWLLQRAVQLTGGNSEVVFVLSIPDWGATPFAAERDTQKIFEEINSFNQVCEHLCLKYTTHFVDITTAQREDADNSEFLAADKLHPSGKEYAKWASLLCEKFLSSIG